jgi:hypothetical protein
MISHGWFRLFCLEEGTDAIARKLRLLEDNAGRVAVKGLCEVRAESYAEAVSIFWKGMQRRVTAPTGMNDMSSRSHCIFILIVERNGRPPAKLYFVDLAGSESVKKSALASTENAIGASPGSIDLSEEAKAINQSLSTLGLVLNRLAERRKTSTNGLGHLALEKRKSPAGTGFSNEPHIPYRSSKLTRVLQEVLSGKTRTTLIINCSISSLQAAETLSTLRFGQRARSLVSTIKGVEMDTNDVVNVQLARTLRAAYEEIQRLRGGSIAVPHNASTPRAKWSEASEDCDGQDSSLSLTPIPHSAPAASCQMPLFCSSSQAPAHFALNASTCQPDLAAPCLEDNNSHPVEIQPRRLFSHGSDTSPIPHGCPHASTRTTDKIMTQTALDLLAPPVATRSWEYPLTKKESCIRMVQNQEHKHADTVARLSNAEAELEWLQWLSPDAPGRNADLTLECVVGSQQGQHDLPRGEDALEIDEDDEICIKEEEEEVDDQVHEEFATKCLQEKLPELVAEVEVWCEAEDATLNKRSCHEEASAASPIFKSRSQIHAKLRCAWMVVPFVVMGGACTLISMSTWWG